MMLYRSIMPTSFQEMLAASLGQFVGHALGQTAAIVLQIAIFWLAWWLPWSRIATRSGFRGRRYWVIMHMVGTAPIVAFGTISFFGQFSSFATGISPFIGLAIYLGIWLLAIAPHNKEA